MHSFGPFLPTKFPALVTAQGKLKAVRPNKVETLTIDQEEETYRPIHILELPFENTSESRESSSIFN